MIDDLLYHERLTSNRTEALFLGLTTLFLALLIWRASAVGFDGLSAALLFFFILFSFYAVNYRTLSIRLTSERLRLTFGIFTWTVALENVESCLLDDVPLLMRMGGAGIHFMFIRKRYRASFNFLEYPRVVIAFKKPAGPVRDISFSTRQPERIRQLVHSALA